MGPRTRTRNTVLQEKDSAVKPAKPLNLPRSASAFCFDLNSPFAISERKARGGDVSFPGWHGETWNGLNRLIIVFSSRGKLRRRFGGFILNSTPVISFA